MPRVPIVDQSSIAPAAPYGDARPILQEADQTAARLGRQIAQSTAMAGQAVMGEIARQDKEAADAKKQAQGVALADAKLRFQLDLQAQLAEAGKLKGLEASKKRKEVLEGLRKSREQISGELADPEVQAKFLEQSVESLVGAAGSFERHVAGEYDSARIGTLKSLDALAIGRLESQSVPDEEKNDLQHGVEDAIRANAESPEQARAMIADFRSRATFAHLQGLISHGKLAEAAQVLEFHEPTLGTRATEARALLERARAGAEHDAAVGAAERFINDTTEGLRDEDGLVSEESLRGSMALDEMPEAVREEARRLLEQKVRVEDARKRAKIEDARNVVDRSDLNHEPIPGATRAFLEKHDAGFLLARQRRMATDARVATAMRRGNERTRGQTAKALNAMDDEFRYRLTRELALDPKANPDDVLTDWINENAEAGREVTISPKMRERAGAMKVEATQKDERADAKATASQANDENAMARELERVLEDSMKAKLKKGQKLDYRLLRQRVGRAIERWKKEVAANGGKQLDASQMAAIKADMVDTTPVVEEGFLFDTTTQVPNIDLPPPPPGVPSKPTRTTSTGTYELVDGKWKKKK